jgi:hypothetical protein
MSAKSAVDLTGKATKKQQHLTRPPQTTPALIPPDNLSQNLQTQLCTIVIIS